MVQTIVDPCIAMYLFLISIFKWIAVIYPVSKYIFWNIWLLGWCASNFNNNIECNPDNNNWECCTKESPCGEKHGDCDADEHCMEGLTCGTDNCRSMYSNVSFPNINIQMDWVVWALVFYNVITYIE